MEFVKELSVTGVAHVCNICMTVCVCTETERCLRIWYMHVVYVPCLGMHT